MTGPGNMLLGEGYALRAMPMAALYSELLAMSWRLDSEKYAFIPPGFFL